MNDKPHISNETIYEGKVINLRRERVTLPNGMQVEFEIVDHPGGAAVVALDERDRVCLVRQYRHVAGDYIWELPAGKIDDREPPVRTAQRELEDEAGIRAQTWFSLGAILTSPGVFDETVHLWLARTLTAAEQNTEPDEDLEVHWVPFDEALQWARDGTIVDAKSVAGLFRADRFV